MPINFLVPESIARADGIGPELALGALKGKPLKLTLGINRIVEEEYLNIAVYGSSDNRSWTYLTAFPHKCYCGIYSLFLDLHARPEVRYLRAQWKMTRWAAGEDRTPLFGFHLTVELAPARMAAAVG